jgi:hypothetical protein
MDQHHLGVARILRNILLVGATSMVSWAACSSVGNRLGLWTPIAAHTAFVLAAVLAALAALTFLPFGRLSRRAAHGLHQYRGEVVAGYLVAVGAAIAAAYLIVAPH